MLSTFKADLHLHTCLSPCGDLDCSPRGVVEAALKRGLSLIAVCDHNTAENVEATFRAAKRAGGPVVVAGMEVCSQEEVHILALFERPDEALEMQTLVYAHLPPRTNRPEVFGEQVQANEDDEVEGFNERLLIAATDLGLAAVVDAIHQRHGLAVPSHIDREAYGLLGQLGFIPPDLKADALEVSGRADLKKLTSLHPELAGWPLIRSSDAHFIEDVGSAWTEFLLARASLDEIRLALAGQDGRKIIGLS
ncbi:MAG: PHP domain-containing protein [Deltaproteobacteria bacterium]|nr:PHP domain-containing protein [Deltaproteobacteria bacterium]